MKKIHITTVLIILLLSLILQNIGTYFTILVAGLMFIIYSIYFIKNSKIIKSNKILNKLPKVYIILVAIFIISFLFIESMIIINMNNNLDKETKDIKYAVVLGASLKGDEVGRVLKDRLDEVINYYSNNKKLNIIVTGGLGKEKVITEASAMYRYLVDNGVNSKNIIKEDRAKDTVQNLKFSKKI